MKIIMHTRKMYYFIPILAITFLVSGCATKLVEQVKTDEQNVTAIKNEIDRGRAALASNTEVYVGGECTLPPRSGQPPLVCENDSEAEKVGMAACAATYGCSASILAFKEGLSTFQEKWMTTEACSALSRKLKSQGYSIDHTLYNLTVATVDSGCEKEAQGFWGTLVKAGSCLTAYAMAAERGIAFSNCITREANKCEAATVSWKQEPIKKQERCEEQVTLIKSKEMELHSLQSSIDQRKNTLTWKLFGE